MKDRNRLKPLSIDNLSLKIEKGQFVALVGDLGSGKSSILNMILGELRCSDN